MEVTRDWQMKRKMSGRGEIIRYSKLKERKEKKALPVYNRIPWHACESATPRMPCHPGNTSLTAVSALALQKVCLCLMSSLGLGVY